MVDDLFSAGNLRKYLDFYIASFTRSRDDLHQWQNYAQDGHGFALGFAPPLFAIEDKPGRKPHEQSWLRPCITATMRAGCTICPRSRVLRALSRTL